MSVTNVINEVSMDFSKITSQVLKNAGVEKGAPSSKLDAFINGMATNILSKGSVEDKINNMLAFCVQMYKTLKADFGEEAATMSLRSVMNESRKILENGEEVDRLAEVCHNKYFKSLGEQVQKDPNIFDILQNITKKSNDNIEIWYALMKKKALVLD